MNTLRFDLPSLSARTGVLAALLVAAVSWTASVHAVPARTLSELREDCAAMAAAPESLAAQRCVIYVQGFLDGAVATDERVALNVAEEIERTETLTERAIRVRLGDRLRQRGPSYYAEYCVGDPVPVQEVVAHVIAEMDDTQKPATALARDVVYAALRRHYPCS